MATQDPAPTATEFQDYWQEYSDIQEGKDPDQGDTGSEDELDSRTPDEAEEAAEWLHSAGMGDIANQVLEGRDVDEEIIESTTLTKIQQGAVVKRINTLKQTLRKRNKLNRKTDVRDIFSQQQAAGEAHSPQPLLYTTARSRESSSTLTDSQDAFPLSTSPPLAKATRNVSILRRREYNMGGDGNVASNKEGIEMLSIKDSQGRQRFSSVASDDSVLTGAIISAPVIDSDISLSLPAMPTDQQISPQSFSSWTTSSGPPFSPMSLGSSASSVSPSSWRGSIDYSSGLPAVTAENDSLGITSINWLSPADVLKLRPLLIIELSALFDNHHLTYARRKSKKKFRDSGIFGVPIQTLLEQDQKLTKNPHLRVPVFFQELLNFLQQEAVSEEGILRVPGSVTRIKSLRKEIDESFQSGKFQWEDVRPNDAAGLLKLFLRELPVPLLTFEHVEAFAQVEQVPNLHDQIEALKLLVLLLPPAHRDTLEVLLLLLRKIVDATENKMTLSNVSMIMAPNLFLLQSGGNRHSKGIKPNEFRMAAGTSNIVRMMIFYHDVLWIVPTTMIQQIRHQYDTENSRKSKDKSIIKLWGKKDKSDVYKKPHINNEDDYNRGVVRVRVPTMNKFNTAIMLENQTTARDIVIRCLQDTAGPQRDSDRLNGSGNENEGLLSYSLFEIGGNIGERRLNQDTRVLEVLRNNPNADWCIKYTSSTW